MENRFGEWRIDLAIFTSPHMGVVCGRMLVKFFLVTCMLLVRRKSCQNDAIRKTRTYNVVDEIDGRGCIY